MYYSATPDVCHEPERGHCLAIATATSPAGPFVDMGMPLLLGMGFEYIDPMAYDDPGDRQAPALLGIGLPADQNAGAGRRSNVVRPREPADRSHLAQSGKGAFPRLVEAAWVIRHDDFYYLFYSGDNCCGPAADYGVMVARSKEREGTVRDARRGQGRAAQPDAVQKRALAGAGPQLRRHRQGWRGVDPLSRDRREPAASKAGGRNNSRRILLIDRIQWKDGWPYVGTPSDEPQAAPVT